MKSPVINFLCGVLFTVILMFGVYKGMGFFLLTPTEYENTNHNFTVLNMIAKSCGLDITYK